MNELYIKSLDVQAFRGLADVHIEECRDVNLILGDNNSGKTSLLEAIALLRGNDVYDFVEVSRSRKSATTNLKDIHFLYPMDGNAIAIKAVTKEGDIRLRSEHEVKQIIFDKDIYMDNGNDPTATMLSDLLNRLIDQTKQNGKPVNQIVGKIQYNNEIKDYALVDLDFYGKISMGAKRRYPIVYVSPRQHYDLSALNITPLLKDKSQHNILVGLLQLFDPSVEDILLLQSQDLFQTPEIHLRRKGKNESEPITLFGDGMKKVITLAVSLVNATGGILLLDEAETSIHHSLFDDVFHFLLLSAHAYHVQLFIATHSLEAVDSILSVTEDDRLANTCLLTLRHNQQGQVEYRYLSGEEAKNYRESIQMEVR